MFAFPAPTLHYEFVIWLFAQARFGFSNFVPWSGNTGLQEKSKQTAVDPEP